MKSSSYEKLDALEKGHGRVATPPPSSDTGAGASTASPKSSRFLAVFSAVLFGTVSTSAIFMNKAVVTTWQFNFPLTMILSQVLWTLISLIGLKSVGVIDYEELDWNLVKKTFPLALTFVLNNVAGLSAMHFVSLPMFVTLRRCAALNVLLTNFMLQGLVEPRLVQASVYLMAFGTIIAGIYDLQFDLFGYLYVFVCNCLSALQLAMVKRLNTAEKLSPFAMLYYNNVLTAPVLLMAWMYSSEAEGVMNFPFLYNPMFLTLFFIAVCQIFVLNYASFLCTGVNSALTTTIVGNLKNILVTFGGYLVFSDSATSFLNFLGVCIGLVGCLWYSYLKAVESKVAKEGGAHVLGGGSGNKEVDVEFAGEK